MNGSNLEGTGIATKPDTQEPREGRERKRIGFAAITNQVLHRFSGVTKIFRNPHAQSDAAALQGVTDELGALTAVYRLPNDPELTERDILRYTESNARLQQELSRLLQRNFASSDIATRRIAIEDMSLLSEADRLPFQQQIDAAITKGMSSQDRRDRVDALKAVGGASVEERRVAIEQGLDDKEIEVYLVSVGAIKRVPEAERTALIEKAFMTPELRRRFWAIQLVEFAPEAEKPALIQQAVAVLKEGLTHPADTFTKTSLDNLMYIPESERAAYIHKGFSSQNIYTRIEAAKAIKTVPETTRAQFQREQASVFEEIIAEQSAPFQLHLLNMLEANIAIVPEEQQQQVKKHLGQIISNVLTEPNTSNRLIAAESIGRTLEDDRGTLVAQALTDGTREVRLAAVRAIQVVPVEEREKLIAQGMSDGDPDVRIATLVVNGLTLQDIENDYPDLFTRLQEFAETTPLYNDREKSFLQGELVKTGSRTMLYDAVPGQEENSLRNRIIKRIIGIKPYMFWKEAFEAADAWQAKGFDYVPVEPIVQVKPNHEVTTDVDVYARVLPGPSADAWLTTSGLYKKEINSAMSRIKSVLEELGIDHGHLHNKNFVVVFDKDATGKPNLLKQPRVYVIDFDMASSST